MHSTNSSEAMAPTRCYLSRLSKWAHSFARLFTILRAALWEKYDLLNLLACHGSAGGSFRHLARPEQAHFPGFL